MCTERMGTERMGTDHMCTEHMCSEHMRTERMCTELRTEHMFKCSTVHIIVDNWCTRASSLKLLLKTVN